jgi:hypothetical protein
MAGTGPSDVPGLSAVVRVRIADVLVYPGRVSVAITGTVL